MARAATTLARFTIALSVAATEQIVTEWATRDGTAIAGEDYQQNSGTVTFEVGETTKVIDVLVYARDIGDEDRSFFIDIKPTPNAILGNSTAECLIKVDQSGSFPVLRFQTSQGVEDVVQEVSGSGDEVAGTFTAGFTIEDRWQVGLHDGIFYKWDGELPKVVPPESTPETTGGFGSGKWINANGESIARLIGLVNTFEAGFTVRTKDELAVFKASNGGKNQWYYWDGVYPKTVPAGSTPETTGGIGSGAWINIHETPYKYRIKEVVGDTYNANVNDLGYIIVFNSVVPCTLNLPASMDVGFYLQARNKDVGDILVVPASGENVDGAGTQTVNPKKLFSVYVESASLWVTAGDMEFPA